MKSWFPDSGQETFFSSHLSLQFVLLVWITSWWFSLSKWQLFPILYIQMAQVSCPEIDRCVLRHEWVKILCHWILFFFLICELIFSCFGLSSEAELERFSAPEMFEKFGNSASNVNKTAKTKGKTQESKTKVWHFQIFLLKLVWLNELTTKQGFPNDEC